MVVVRSFFLFESLAALVLLACDGCLFCAVGTQQETFWLWATMLAAGLWFTSIVLRRDRAYRGGDDVQIDVGR